MGDFKIIQGKVKTSGTIINGQNPKGTWSNAVAYEKGDTVSYSGSNYIAIKAGTNQQPDTATAYWMEIASGGTGGAVDSVNGETGTVVLDADDIDDSATTNKFTSAAEKAVWDAKQDSIGFTPENSANKGQVEGYAGLDANGKLFVANLPDSILGSVNYHGTHDASGGTAPTVAGGANQGDYFVISVAGTISTVSYLVGDWIIYNGTSWDRVDNSDKVSSVNSKTGAVTLDKTDIGLGNVDNTSDAGKPVSTAQQIALDAKAPLTNPQFTSKIGIGVAAANNGLDLLGIIRMASVITDATNKLSYLAARHYTNSEEDFLLFMGKAYQTTNTVSFGGGSASYNSATNIDFYAAADNATTTGTKILAIDSTGATVTGKTKTTTFEDTTANVISTAGKANYLQTRHLNPRSDNNYDLGDTTYAYRDLFLKGSIKSGSDTLTVGNLKTAYDHSQATGDPHKSVRIVQATCFPYTADIATGDGAAYFVVPLTLNGMNLISVHAKVITAGTTGTTDIQIANVTDGVDMLSTKLTIDSGETGSDTADTPAVIDTTKDDVATNDLIRIDIDAASTTKPKGLIVTLSFQTP